MAVKYVKFYRGSQLAFENAIKNSDTLYFITDSNSNKGSLYLGDKLIAGNISAMADLEDILLKNLSHGELLVYDETEQKWVNKSVKDAIGYMTGATDQMQGTTGLVPEPGIGQQNLFLRGDGTWAMPEGAGNSGGGNVYEVESTTFVYADHVAALTTAVGDNALATGDIGIVKTLIATGKYQYTAYVYNGTAWAAMDGNYTPDSIYFDEDLIVTAPIGTITQEMIDNGSGSTVLEAKDKNMTTVLASLLAEEKEPEVTDPTVTFVTSGGSGEVGTTFNLPTATFKVTSVGSYSYGSKDANEAKWNPDATGILFEVGDVILTQDDNTVTNSKDMTKDDTLSITATGSNTYEDADVKFTFVANASYTESDRVPVTNLGNKRPDAQITGALITPITKTATFTGYRNSFCGSGVNAVELNSANIRKLEPTKSSTNTMTVAIVEGARQVIIAVPENRIITKVADEGAFGTDIFSEFNLTSGIGVEGANGYAEKNYNVYVYSPSTALGENTYTVTVANKT